MQLFGGVFARCGGWSSSIASPSPTLPSQPSAFTRLSAPTSLILHSRVDKRSLPRTRCWFLFLFLLNTTQPLRLSLSPPLDHGLLAFTVIAVVVDSLPHITLTYRTKVGRVEVHTNNISSAIAHSARCLP